MKKSELKQMIREELNHIISNTPVDADLINLKKKYPAAIITLVPNERFKGMYFARVDINTQGGENEYLGALKGPVKYEDGLNFITNILQKQYDKFY